MNIVRDLCSEKGEADLVEIYNLSLPRKISEDEVNRVVSKMLQNGELFESSTDKYRLAR